MFYNNLIKGNSKTLIIEPVSFDKSHSLDSINSLEFGTCKQVYNFACNDGVLTDNMGVDTQYVIRYYQNDDINFFKTIPIPESNDYMNNAFFIDAYDFVDRVDMSYIFLIDGNGFLKYYNLNGAGNDIISINTNIRFHHDCDAFPVFWRGSYDVLISGKLENSAIWYKDTEFGNILSQSDDPKIISMCMYDKRSFAATRKKKYTIFYSENLDTNTFTIGNEYSGYINLSKDLGACQRLVEFKDKLYVFREYGISKISKGKDKKDFEVESVLACKNRISEKSIVDCGDRIMFLTTDGIYEFDGTKTKKIETKYDKLISNSYQEFAAGAYFKGHYYVSCKFAFEDGKKIGIENNANVFSNNAYLKLNVTNHKIEMVRGIDVVKFIPLQNTYNDLMLLIFRDRSVASRFGILKECGKIKNKKIMKEWTSKQSDMGYPNKYKFIKEVCFKTKTDVNLNLYFDDKIKTIKVKGKSTMQTIKINQKAKLFGFGFETDEGDTLITCPKFVVNIL